MVNEDFHSISEYNAKRKRNTLHLKSYAKRFTETDENCYA